MISALGALPDRNGDDHFRQQVLPLLRESCFECHGPDKRRVKGGLRMDGQESFLRGGDRGPALVPGDPDASLLVRAVRYGDPLLEMPPDGKLAAEEIAILERWVELGAPWPAGLGRRGPDPEEVRFFEEEVRPVLARSCHECHGPQLETPKSGLRMTGPGLLLGGERGPAIVPGNPGESLLVQAVRGTHAELVMPPSGDPLTEDEMRALERWIELGAPWPSYGEAGLEPLGGREIDLAEGRLWWSFRPVERPAVPDVEHKDLLRTPIDAFVLARLADAGLEPNPAASPRELVRRAYFDLIGLPPTFHEVERFAADPSTVAWERLIDELLARPEYGEHWGRRWLDVVRYAETNGYERDTEKPNAWRYRDYVIRAFNEDKPYDRFVLEQLAGDELDDATDDALIATGFYRLGVWDDEPDDAHQARYDELDDVVRTIGEGLMGLTIGCARCHDHKFDPLRQEDYYATLAFVRNMRPYENTRYAEDSATLRPLGSPEAIAEWRSERDSKVDEWNSGLQKIRLAGRERVVRERWPDLPEEIRAIYLTPPEQRTQEWKDLVARTPELYADKKTLRAALEPEEIERVKQLTGYIDGIEETFTGGFDWALVVRELGPTPPTTHVLIRGRAAARGQEVVPRFVPVLCADDEASVPELSEPGPDAVSSGRRRALAEWIVDPAHPLTARVMVNRVWQGHFGRGLVPTPNDFGSTGAPPTHPELLDWLAAELGARGWSIKELHRLIMRSAAYRMSSRATNATAAARDPANELLWRQNMRRLEAEAIRDSMLVVSGTLESRAGGPSFFPELSRQALAGGYRPGQGWGTSSADEEDRRSIYAYVKRTMLVPLFETFDFANPALPIGARATTTIPNQALTLLNSDFMNAKAAAFAARVRDEAGSDAAAQVARAFELALARRPTQEELRIALDYVERQSRAFVGARPFLTRGSRPGTWRAWWEGACCTGPGRTGST
ncbi:MAG: PSD1 and planctomycete cytochrome C domain-containing protein [Planctomycetota bacterium]|nr:PSD1 and planctomycete cytochrome C domain-containing protein [Planctomycetota bacterium]